MRTLIALAVISLSACQCGDVRLGTLRTSLAVRPEAIDFGTLAVGASDVRELTVENVSRAPIDVTVIELDGSGADQIDVVPKRAFRLEAGQSRTMDAIFSPTRAGFHSATVRIQSSSSTGEVAVVLAGHATATVEADAGTPPVDSGVVDAGVFDAGTTVDAGQPQPTPTCGTANGTDQSTAPTSDSLCATGAATAVTGNGPWRWSCEGKGAPVECSTASYWVTGDHEELRSVLMGQPRGAQRHVSNMTRSEFVNNTSAPVQVVIRLVDPMNRFIWNDGTPMVMRPEVTSTVLPGRRVAPSVLWNSGDDTGTSSDPCNRTASSSGVEFYVAQQKVASFKVHAMGRSPFTCPGGLVTWSATSPNSGGPCRAQVPPAVEFSVPEEVQASTSDSDPGFSGKQGLSCIASMWTMDHCGVSVPVAGRPVTTFPKYGGDDACKQ